MPGPRIQSQKPFSISTRQSDLQLFQRMQDRCEYLGGRASPSSHVENGAQESEIGAAIGKALDSL